MFKQSKKIIAILSFASIFLTILFFSRCTDTPPTQPVGSGQHLSKVASSAILHIFNTSANNQFVNIHGVTSGWFENQVTYNTRPTSGPVEASFVTNVSGAWIDVNITGLFNKWLDGTYDTNFGLMLESAGTNLEQFSSREGANPPYIDVIYSDNSTETISDTADAEVTELHPDGNFGAEPSLFAGTVNGLQKQDLIKFNVEVCVGSIGDFTFWDKDGNGIFDGNDVALPGVGLELQDAQHNVIATTTSDANGAYSFTGLCPGDYYVCYTTIPAGYSEVPTCTNNTDNTTNNMNHCNCLLVTLPQPGGQNDNPNIDFGFKVEGTCLRMPDGSPCGPLEQQLFTNVDGNGDVTVTFNQNLDLVDNSYGTTQVGWGANAPSGKNHKFSDLTGSDKAQFIFYDGNGTKVLDIFVDYISAKTGTPSGYACLGVSGGEGKVNFPTQAVGAPWVLFATTTIADNLNNLGLCVGGNCSGAGTNLLLNSPPTTSSTSYNIVNPVYASWNFVDGYTVKISHNAFGASGFGNVVIGQIHNSPPKCGDNAYTPVLCNGTQPPQTCLDGKPKKLEMMYDGTNCVSSGGTSYGPPCNNQASGKVIVTGDPNSDPSVYIVAYDKQTTSLVWFQGNVALNGTFVIDATAMNKTRLGTNTIVKIYASQGGTLISTVQFHTSCSQPLNVGDFYGSLELTNYVAE